MGKIREFFNSLKNLSSEWTEGICKDLDNLGYSYDKINIKRYYKKRKLTTKYVSGESIKTELDELKEKELIKTNLKKLFITNKKKSDYLTFELHKNKHLLLLNGSMLELSYKECDDISNKKKREDYHFDFLLEDLYLQLFYEERKLNEIDERILLLNDRITLYEKLINTKNTNNEIIDNFMEEFHKSSNSRDELYQYEIEASNLLNEKKYSKEEIESDKEELESTYTESNEMNVNKEIVMKSIVTLKQQVSRVKNIIDLTNTSDDSSDRIRRLEELKKFYEDTIEEETLKWEKSKKELEKTFSSKMINIDEEKRS